jgi:DNA-binding NarL/FixJ family response regulator
VYRASPRPREQVFNRPGFFLRVTLLAAFRSRTTEQPSAPLRVLVVDGDLLYAEAISVLLDMHEGIDVVGIAGDGRAGIEQAESLRPDLVLMDVLLPGLDGITATRRIRRRLPETHVVIMTGLGDEHLERARSAGASGYVQKFCRSGDLLSAIEQAPTRQTQGDPASRGSERAGARGTPRWRR